MVAKPQGQQPDSPLAWLEEELRQTKARLHKVEHELDQALKQVWSLEADLRKLAEALATSSAAVAALPGLKEEMRRLRDELARSQERQIALANRAEAVLRQREADAGREREERAALAKQVDALARGVGQFESRMQALEEAYRHVDEQTAGARLVQQGLARDVEELTGRSARHTEFAVRMEHELARAAEEIESLRKQDEALADQLNLGQEQIRRQRERLDKLDEVAAFPAEARELLHRERFEREQMAERLGVVERAGGELSERVQEFVQGLARLDQRGQAQVARLLEMAEQLQDLADQTKGQTKRLLQVILRQRRRQAEALAQEIKELSQGELSSGA